MQIKKSFNCGRLRRFAGLLLTLTLACCITVSAAALELVPVGRTVGISLSAGGLFVSGLADIETENGSICPAAEAGVCAGDLITAVNGAPVSTAEEFISAIAGSIGRAELSITRGGSSLTLSVTPVDCGEGTRKLGLWLRDGVSGVGTITFYDPESGLYGALGHAVSDVDSGVIIPAHGGNIMRSQIVGVRRGECGVPGELCGCYDESAIVGGIDKNTVFGIFGHMSGGDYCTGAAIPAAGRDSAHTGSARIIANVSGESSAFYDIQITRLYSGDSSGRSMMLKVTDPELLELTGGIVQGMSGSPIIQDGKLVGAVTHVLVNDPTTGYGIFIENMLDAAG